MLESKERSFSTFIFRIYIYISYVFLKNELKILAIKKYDVPDIKKKKFENQVFKDYYAMKTLLPNENVVTS